MIHEIKLKKEFEQAVLCGDKNFEIRFNDRGYQKGDKVKFKVMDGIYRERSDLDNKLYEITYVLNGWGLQDNYVVFGIKEIDQ